MDASLAASTHPRTVVTYNTRGVRGLIVATDVFSEAAEARYWSLCQPMTPQEGSRAANKHSTRIIRAKLMLPRSSRGREAECQAWQTIAELVNAVKDAMWPDQIMPDYALFQTYLQKGSFQLHYDSRYGATRHTHEGSSATGPGEFPG